MYALLHFYSVTKVSENIDYMCVVVIYHPPVVDVVAVSINKQLQPIDNYVLCYYFLLACVAGTSVAVDDFFLF